MARVGCFFRFLAVDFQIPVRAEPQHARPTHCRRAFSRPAGLLLRAALPETTAGIRGPAPALPCRGQARCRAYLAMFARTADLVLSVPKDDPAHCRCG